MPCDEPISPLPDLPLPYHAARVAGRDPSVAEFVAHWWPLHEAAAANALPTESAEGN